jgi:xanthine dehydrogenase large subunit
VGQNNQQSYAAGIANINSNLDAYTHTRGESIYLDDIPLLSGTLFGVAFGSPVAHGIIRKLDLSEAEKIAGVIRIFTHKDIPGQNQIGGIVLDEPLFAEDLVHFNGMPIAFVVAESQEIAYEAARHIRVDIDPLPVISDPREAKERGELIIKAAYIQAGRHSRSMAAVRIHIRRRG